MGSVLSAGGWRENAVARRDLATTVGVFAAAAARYWLSVFPRVAWQLHRLRRAARAIPDPTIRQLALQALDKRSNIEGAAAFAAFVPARSRAAAVRALVGFQATYNLTDTLAEAPCADPAANAQRLHSALLGALEPTPAPVDYLEHNPQSDDGGYLTATRDICRAALDELPSYAAVAATARTAAEKIVAFQTFSVASEHGEAGSEWERLRQFSERHTPAGSDLYWWETAAAAGSSLLVHALLAAAAEPALQASQVGELAGAYFPWAGALHSLLDSVVDEAEDARSGQLSLIGCYPTRTAAVARVRKLADGAARRVRQLRNPEAHTLLLAAMTGSYVHAARAAASGADDERAIAELTDGVMRAVGPFARPVLLVFALRGLANGKGGVDAGAA